jgi:hypothetical protein
MKTAKHCSGCRDDFYNGKNPQGVEVCWSLKGAKLVTRYRLHINTPCNHRAGYHKARVPTCYHERGYVYVDAIPEFAK